MKKLLLLLPIFFAVTLKAQQDPLYSQYWVNASVINPAQTSVNGNTSLSLSGRYQWINMKGAPQTHLLTFQTQQAENVGIGASYVFDRIGPVMTHTLNMDGAYHLKISREWTASLGTRLSAAFTQMNLTDLYTAQQGDPAFSQNVSAFCPNIGFGLLIHNRHFYAGYAEPRALEYDLSATSGTSLVIKSHRFLYGGYNFMANENIEIRPSMLIKHVSSGPMQMDLNVAAEFMGRISGGLSYRTGDGLGMMIGYNPVEKLRIYYCYDFPLSVVAQVSMQTHQLTLIYNFNRSEEINSLKFFE